MRYHIESHWNYGPDEDYNAGRGLAASSGSEEDARALFERCCIERYSVDLYVYADNGIKTVVEHYGPPTEDAIRSMQQAYQRRHGKEVPAYTKLALHDELVEAIKALLAWVDPTTPGRTAAVEKAQRALRKAHAL